jgi:TPR repeat protein
MYAFAFLLPRDTDRAAILFRRAARQGYAPGERELGFAYWSGSGTEHSDADALAWFTAASGQGPWRVSSSAPWWSPGTARGRISRGRSACSKPRRMAAMQAMSRIGYRYLNGVGVPIDKAKAAAMFRRAAEANPTTAMCNLSLGYTEGWAGERDSMQALDYLRRAAGRGYAGAQYALWLRYENGTTVAGDAGEAMTWYRLAAVGGNADAFDNIGNVYLNGKLGEKQDDAEAVRWYRAAAARCHAYTTAMLATINEQGRGVPADQAEAVA